LVFHIVKMLALKEVRKYVRLIHKTQETFILKENGRFMFLLRLTSVAV